MEQEIEDPLRESSIGCEEHPGSDHSDAVHVLFLQKPVLVASEQFASGMVWNPGDYGDFMPFGHPLTAVFMSPARGSVDLRREVVADEEYAHSRIPGHEVPGPKTNPEKAIGRDSGTQLGTKSFRSGVICCAMESNVAWAWASFP